MLKKYPTLAAALLASLTTLAQPGTELIRFKSGTGPAAAEASASMRHAFGLDAQSDLRPLRMETDELGFMHQRYQQFYQGVPVERAVLTAHTRGGRLESVSGEAAKELAGLSVQPTVGESAALAAALQYVGARKYMWEQKGEAQFARESEGKASFRPTGERVIIKDLSSGKPVLAWKFNIYATEPLSRAWVYVDARTGQVLFQEAIIKHTAATATFATAYSGTRSLANDMVSSTSYRLRETTRGLGIETYNCRKGNSYTSAVDFTDADNNWTAAEVNNANFDNVAGDAHFGAQATYDYWSAVHARNSYDNAGAKIKSYVHFDDIPGGAGYENAYWNGSVMTYGDGASTFKPLTSMDVCGHEIGHAVCEKTANLAYQNESGGMNEGFSDIWGACIEARAAATYALTGKSTWLIGEEIMRAGGALRSMSNPNAYGQPDTYKGSYWVASVATPTDANDYGGVHTNSGVLNFWFYLLSQGGSGTNDKGSAYTVAGVTIDKAAKIAYRTESVYLSASSTYANARTGAIQAATDLYGAGSAEVIATTNAWYAVGVGAAYGGTTPPPSGYCASNGTNVTYEYIRQVAIGTINRTSVADAGYYNGTALSTSVAQGSSQTLTYAAGYVSTAYTEYFNVWVDFNKNNVFTDAGEQIVLNRSTATNAALTTTFTVPATATVGAVRMRVSMRDGTGQASCGTFTYGEVEDYTLNITAGGTTPPPAPTYCASKGTSVAYEYIDHVAIGTINRTSGADAGYYNGSALSATVGAGTSQTINVSAGFVGTAYAEFFRVYADWNNNGVFTDAGETLVSSASSTVTTDRAFAFTVPAGTTNGAHRLRVVMSDNSATASCGSYSYGETEDYTLTVTGGTVRGLAGTTPVAPIGVYPNPANDVLHLSLADGATVTSATVYDVRGAQMARVTFDGRQTLNVASLPAGLYSVVISDGTQQQRVRFAKQ